MVLNASDTIVVLDADGTITYESPVIERVLGFKPEERVGTNAFEYVHPDNLEPARRAVAELVGRRGPPGPQSTGFATRKAAGATSKRSAMSLLHDPSVRGIVVNSRASPSASGRRKR